MFARLGRRIVLPVIILLLLGVGAWGYNFYLREIKVVPEELIVKALDTTHAATSYRFRLEGYLEADGGRIEVSQVTGERSAGGDLHLWGKMTGQEVDVYQIQDTTYFKDPLFGRWMVTPGNSPLQQELFMAEVNPLSILKITKIQDLQYKGRQKNVPGRPYLLELRPEINNRLLNTYWRNFYYKLWVERGSHYIRKVELVADHRQKPGDKLRITLELYDFNKVTKINPPTQ
ncbi:hypothetical protein V3F56_07950 [Moorellaceae bacterium AZ2]